MIDHKSNYGQIGIRSGQHIQLQLEAPIHDGLFGHSVPSYPAYYRNLILTQLAQKCMLLFFFLIWEQLLTPLLLPNWTKTFYFFSPSREPEWEPKKIKIGLSARNRKGLGHFVQKKSLFGNKLFWKILVGSSCINNGSGHRHVPGNQWGEHLEANL